MLTLCSQLCCFDLYRVAATAASRAVHVPVASVSVAFTVASLLFKLSRAMRSSPPSTRPKTNFRLGTAISTFNSRYMLMTSMLTLLCRQVDQGVAILHPLGEFCDFAPFRHVLTISISFAAVPVSFPMLWLSLHPLDGFVVSPKPFDSCERCFAPPLGEFRVFGSFGSVLMFPSSFAGIIARVCMFSMRVVPGLVRFICAAICAYGKWIWRFDPIACILMVSASSLAISTLYPALGMSMYMLDLSAWFLQPFGLSGRPLAALSGEFGCFCSFRLLLTVSTSSGGVSVSFAMLCMPVCTFDMSEWFPQLFGSSECRFALRLYLQCVLSHRHSTLGESPLGEAQLGHSVPLVV